MAAVTTYFSSSFQISSQTTSSTSTQTNSGLIQVIDQIAPSATVVEVVAYDVTKATAIYVSCDQAGTTMTPNTGASAILTFTDPTQPFTWIATNPAGAANPWSADFASLSVVNGSSTVAANITIQVVYTA